MQPTLFDLSYHRAPSAPRPVKPVVREGRKGRNLRGEVLEEKVNGVWQHRVRYTARDVQCPHCKAAPRRKCAWTVTDLPDHYVLDKRLPAGGRRATYKETQREAARRTRSGSSHRERTERAHALSEVHGRKQLALRPPRPPAAASGWTHAFPDRTSAAAYLHLIRAPDDPSESTRGANSERRREWGIAPHRTLAAQSPTAWREPLRTVLAAHPESTFNAMTVRLTGLTADVCFGTALDTALWTLAAEGEVERTTTTPIRWRLVSP